MVMMKLNEVRDDDDDYGDDDDDGENSEDVPAVQTRTADAACTDPEEGEIHSEAGHPWGQSRGDCPACTSCTSAPVEGKQNYHRISCQLPCFTILNYHRISCQLPCFTILNYHRISCQLPCFTILNYHRISCQLPCFTILNYHRISCQLPCFTILKLASSRGARRKGEEAFSTLISNHQLIHIMNQVIK